MYWIRSTPLDLLPLLLLCALWAGGGWLLAAYAFRLRARERLWVGLSIGLLLFILLSNAFYQLPGLRNAPITVAFWLAAGFIALLGLLAARRSPLKAWFSIQNRRPLWPQMLAFSALLLIFALIQRGLAIFDDYHNLPLASMIAAGDVPPHFYLNPEQRLAYHYGLHLFAASLMRVGAFYPWSAFDLSKALTIVLTAGLAWLWLRRLTRDPVSATWGAGLIVFASGARWLLLLLPSSWLIQIGHSLQLLGSGAQSGPDLYSALANPWKIEGGGPFPFPFAFVNGVFPSLVFAMTGTGALPHMTIFLLLLLGQKAWKPLPALVYSLILASLALSAEHLFVLIWLGWLIAAGLGRLRKGVKGDLRPWAWILGLGLILALAQGGVITEALRGWLVSGQMASAPEYYGFSGFSLRWPPAILSAHLGTLELARPAHWVVALAEVGPLILLVPWVIKRTVRKLGRGQILITGIGLAALAGFVLPLFVRYGVERDISRLTGSALFIWLILGFPYLWLAWKSGQMSLRLLSGVGSFILVLGGITLFSVQLIAISRPQLTYFIDETDALMSQKYWNRLEEGAQVLDFTAVRAVTLFGRAGGRAFRDYFTPLPEREALLAELDPLKIRQAGYSYFYLDRHDWQRLSSEEKQALQQPCVQRLESLAPEGKDFRWLLDVRACP